MGVTRGAAETQPPSWVSPVGPRPHRTHPRAAAPVEQLWTTPEVHSPAAPQLSMDLSTLARQQHGLVTRAQAIDQGLSREAVRWRLDRGWWRRVHPGVYLTHSGELDWLGRA